VGEVASVSIAPHCNSKGALRFSGTGSPASRPAIRALLRSAGGDGTAVAFYDGGAYRGLRLSLRSPRPARVRLLVPDRNTDAAGAMCRSCGDHFGAELDLVPDWRTFFVPFAALRQRGTGDRRSGLARNDLLAIELEAGPSGPFEVWVDFVSFFR
jgi:hypothetical protein